MAPNITPDPETGAGRWSDEQLARAIREGIGHDGRRLLPIMPYLSYASMSDEDLAAVIVYLRSIPPVKNALAETPLPEPAMNLLPPPTPVTGPVPPPDSKDPVKRGEYLVILADCRSCHTPVDEQMQFLPGMDFAGGRYFEGPWGKLASANVTFDASGIGYYDEKMFIQTMRTGTVGGNRHLNSIMLWGYFRGMSDRDLKDVYAYLKSLKHVQHRVDNTEAASACRLCNGVHGLGSRN